MASGWKQVVRPVAHQVHAANRQRKIRFLQRTIHQHGIKSVLLVGVIASDAVAFDNAVERSVIGLAPHVVASGLDPEGLSVWPEYVQADGRDLPFDDQEFDLVLSNAVVEHVGDEADQRRFLEEHHRVGRHWIATTPNRAFPVEAHTYTLFRHWSDAWAEARPRPLRLLTPRGLEAILPPESGVKGGWASLTLAGVSSSLAG